MPDDMSESSGLDSETQGKELMIHLSKNNSPTALVEIMEEVALSPTNTEQDS